MKVIRKACRQREELQIDEGEHCRLIKSQIINGAACLMAIMATLKTLDFRRSLGGGQLRHSTDT